MVGHGGIYQAPKKEWSSAIVPQKTWQFVIFRISNLHFWVRLLFSMSVSVFVETLPNRSGNFWTISTHRKTLYFKL